MKKIVLTIFILICCAHSFAQDKKEDTSKSKIERPPRKETEKHKIIRPLRCPSLYITASTGINNNTGLLGFSFDVPVAKSFSVEGGAGLSSWGYKIAVSGKYYLQPCQRGWAFGAGFTYNTGIANTQQNLATVSGQNEEVGLDLHPQTNLFFAAYHYWSLGKRYNRFYLELGYSVPLTAGDKFEQLSGDQITGPSTATINLISPGGLIIGAGFSFGMN